MSLKMMNDYVLVQRDKPEEKRSPGGVIIPAKNQVGEVSTWATVIAVGWKENNVCVGDRVMIGPFVGTEVSVGGEKFSVVKWADIMCVEIKEDED